jgi:hypothetical protein
MSPKSRRLKAFTNDENRSHRETIQKLEQVKDAFAEATIIGSRQKK